jgi:hypothetical protein
VNDELLLGALLRIADAVESIASKLEPCVSGVTAPDRSSRSHMLERPVSAIDLPLRVRNVLFGFHWQRRAERDPTWPKVCQTVGDLCSRTPQDLLGLRGLGETSLRAIREELEKHGLHLGMAYGNARPAEGAVPT